MHPLEQGIAILVKEYEAILGGFRSATDSQDEARLNIPQAAEEKFGLFIPSIDATSFSPPGDPRSGKCLQFAPRFPWNGIRCRLWREGPSPLSRVVSFISSME